MILKLIILLEYELIYAEGASLEPINELVFVPGLLCELLLLILLLLLAALLLLIPVLFLLLLIAVLLPYELLDYTGLFVEDTYWL